MERNDIFYKGSPTDTPVRVTSDGSSSVLNGVTDKTYKSTYNATTKL